VTLSQYVGEISSRNLEDTLITTRKSNCDIDAITATKICVYRTWSLFSSVNLEVKGVAQGIYSECFNGWSYPACGRENIKLDGNSSRRMFIGILRGIAKIMFQV
ncbi:hypothetical protein OTU49_003654, partial [Cherax quadricarinatus]